MFPLSLIAEFLDVGFFRLAWALFVQYLVATNFLQPSQQQQWVDGAGHIISIAGTVIFLAIWQWKSHHKTLTVKTENETTVDLPEKADSNTDIESIRNKYLPQP